jgi:four helix bundle protein
VRNVNIIFSGLKSLAGSHEADSGDLQEHSQLSKHELYGLSQQIRRAAVSVPSNIAEGKGHRSDKEFTRFLLHSRGSLLELQTQLLIAEELQYLSKGESQRVLAMAEGVARALSGLINSLCEKAA